MGHEAYLEPILRELRVRRVIAYIPPGAQLLDIGCGRSATFLKAISRQIAQGIGVDAKVQPMQLGNLQIIQQRLTDELPFEADRFDVVTMLAVLEHLEDEQPILQEIRRVLKPDGRLILTVPSVWAQPVLEFLAYRLKLVDEAEICEHQRYYHRARLHQVLIDDAQFRRFEHRYFQLGMNNFCTVIK